MKLSEIAQQEHEQIKKRLQWLAIDHYAIHPDGTVDVRGDVNVSNILEPTLPVRFGKVTGSFDCYGAQFMSFKGFPNFIGRNLHLYDTRIYSYSGINKVIKHIGGRVGGNDTVTHILGLLLIDGLQSIQLDCGPIDEIMNRYLPTHNVIMAQDELIDAGFIEQAKL